MNIIILTQNDPFYLAENIEYLLNRLPEGIRVSACVMFDASPFGKRLSIYQKIRHTLNIFGPKFLLHFSCRLFLNKLSLHNRVKDVFQRRGISILYQRDSINSSESLEQIRRYHPDLLISIAANQVFKKPLIELAPKGCLNLHTALLPKYRGLFPTFWALKNDERTTGVSVFFVDEGVDTGPILVQKEIEIGNRTLEELIQHTKRIGMDAITDAISLIQNQKYTLQENRIENEPYYSFPSRDDVKQFLASGKKFY